MRHTADFTAYTAYPNMAFSSIVDRIRRGRTEQSVLIQPACLKQALAELAEVRKLLPNIADDIIVSGVFRHNPDIFQMVVSSEDGSRLGFLAFLPLNDQGMDALLSGSLNPSAPDLSLICRPRERPKAVYIWLIFAPGQFVPVFLALDRPFATLSPDGCPLFFRPASGPAALLFEKLGFNPAVQLHAAAPADLWMLGTTEEKGRGDTPASDRDVINVRVARTFDDVLKGFSVRAATYMSEQLCPFDEEFDGNDFCAAHFLGEINGEPAGCIRVRFFADFVKIERLAVRQEFRTSKLAFALVRAALNYSRRKGYRRAYGHSRTDLTRFWGLFGFRAIAGRPAFVFSDVEYVELHAELSQAADVVEIGSDPYVLIRPEGDWDQPGPLDKSVARLARERS
ncbi:GNAT family N-acetyltransferase [Sphingobium chungbukense]|nr:GNAT family N-acetyltransferase [Sphingobium chungbukense]